MTSTLPQTPHQWRHIVNVLQVTHHFATATTNSPPVAPHSKCIATATTNSPPAAPHSECNVTHYFTTKLTLDVQILHIFGSYGKLLTFAKTIVDGVCIGNVFTNKITFVLVSKVPRVTPGSLNHGELLTEVGKKNRVAQPQRRLIPLRTVHFVLIIKLWQ